MFRFTRTHTVNHSADVPAALQFAAEVSSYLKKNYSMDVKVGIEGYGNPTIYWYYDFDDMNKFQGLVTKSMTDREYIGLLGKAKGLFVGQIKDTLVICPD
jgi:hypothetical protein